MRKYYFICLMAIAIFTLVTGSSCQKTTSTKDSFQSTLDSINGLQVVLYDNLNLYGSSFNQYSRGFSVPGRSGYPYATFNGAASSIDVIYDSATFYNYDPSGIKNITNTGTKFGLTNITPAQFDSITTRSAFEGYTATLNSIHVKAGDVIYLLTKDNYKSFFKITAVAPSITAYVSFNCKIAIPAK